MRHFSQRRKRTKSFFAALGFFAFTLLSLSSASAQTQTKRAAREALSNVDPRISVSGSVGNDTIRLGARYKLEINPSYQSGLYTRTDRWQLQVPVNPIPGFKLVPGSEVVVVRQFESKKKALGASPQLKLGSLPFSSSRANEMEPGSIMMFSVTLEDRKGVEASAPLPGPLTIRGRAGHVDRGSFQVQVQKLQTGNVRLRLVSTRQHAFEAEASLRLGASFIRKTVASAGVSKGPQSLVSAEYEFNMNDPEARRAYNSIFAKGGLRPRFALANPLTNAESTTERLAESLSPAQEIAAGDVMLPRADRRVSKSYQSVSTSNPLKSNHGFNLLHLATFRKSTSVASRAHLTYEDANGVKHETPSTSYEMRKQTKRLFGLRNEQEIRRASFIAKDEGGTGEYIVSLELKDKRLGKSETEKARAQLRRLIAPSILRKLNLDSLLESRSYKNARIYTQVVFTEKAFEALRGLGASEIENRLTAYLVERKERSADNQQTIRKASALLAEALSAGTTVSQRLDVFGDLQKLSLFRDTGSGFLMSLLPEDELEDRVSVLVRIDANTFTKPLIASFGHSDFRQIEKATECADYQQNRTELDLRLEDVCATTSSPSNALSSSTAGAPAGQVAPPSAPPGPPATSVN